MAGYAKDTTAFLSFPIQLAFHAQEQVGGQFLGDCSRPRALALLRVAWPPVGDQVNKCMISFAPDQLYNFY